MNLVTLIIPTYNRPDFLQRILNYYNKSGVKFKIIIADSSKHPVKKLNRKIVLSYPKLNILYLDKFSPDLVSHHKFAKMVEFVKTKYCVFCADDDFIIPNGIEEAVDFLEKYSDYSAAHGSYIYFYIHKTLTGKKTLWWNFIYPYKSITYEKPVDRLIAHPTDCQQVLWAVRRTDIVKKSYKEFLKFKVDPLLFGERLPDVLTVIFGKMKRLNNFYAARQAFSTASGYWPSERDAIKEGAFDKEFDNFKACIVANLKRDSKTTKKQVEEIIDKNMEMYINSSLQQYIVARINLALKSFPDFTLKGLTYLHAKYLFFKEKKDRIGRIDSPSSKFFNDFCKIKDVVLNASEFKSYV